MQRNSARELVMAFGWNSTAYQILNPGITHWFAECAPAVVGYVVRDRFLLVAGGPVCREGDIGQVVSEFEAFARRDQRKVCYVCAAERMRTLLESSNEHAVITIGAEPVWDPQAWEGVVQARSSLRAQLRRARNKGVRVEVVPAAEARADEQIQATLQEWLKTRMLPPMRFLVEPHTLWGETEDRVLLVARRNERTIAFLLASPVVARNGYLIEQIARSPRAPNGTSELLIDYAMRQFAAEGRAHATLGLVALAETAEDGIVQNPSWVRGLMRVARAYANQFYNFRGLERFRAKMQPQCWEKIYAISNEPVFTPFALYAIGGAFSGISPTRAISMALLKAARHETRRALGLP